MSVDQAEKNVGTAITVSEVHKFKGANSEASRRVARYFVEHPTATLELTSVLVRGRSLSDLCRCVWGES